MASALAPACVLCNGAEWRPADADPSRMTRCDCWLSRQRPYAENVPLEFQAARLENYRPMSGNKTALRIAGAFLGGVKDLYICGPVGSGKTRLGASLLNDYFADTKHGLFLRVAQLLRELEPPRDQVQSEESARLERRFKTEALIVLDDIGAERTISTDYTRRMLLLLYEARSDKGLRTIWTSNLRLDVDPKFGPDDRNRPLTLGEFLNDDRLPSRIAGRSDVVLLTCGDQRLTEREITR